MPPGFQATGTGQLSQLPLDTPTWLWTKPWEWSSSHDLWESSSSEQRSWKGCRVAVVDQRNRWIPQMTLLHHQQPGLEYGFHKEHIRLDCLAPALSFVLPAFYPAYYCHCYKTGLNSWKDPNLDFLGVLKMSHKSLFLVCQVPEENQQSAHEWQCLLRSHNVEHYWELLSVADVWCAVHDYSIIFGILDFFHNCIYCALCNKGD